MTDWRRDIYRASKLDEFRAYLSGELWNGDDYTAAEFVRRMTERQSSPALDAGTAVHELFEHAPFGVVCNGDDRRTSNGWRVRCDCDIALAIPPLREVELQRTHKGITLHGRCDVLWDEVRDHKTTSSIDVDRYMDSFQWRAYLYMAERTRFVYDIFRVKLDEDEHIVTIQEYVPLKVYRYPGMDREVENLLVDFDAAIKSLGIDRIMAGRAAA